MMASWPVEVPRLEGSGRSVAVAGVRRKTSWTAGPDWRGWAELGSVLGEEVVEEDAGAGGGLLREGDGALGGGDGAFGCRWRGRG